VRWQLLLIGIPFGLILLWRRHWHALAALCLGTLLLAWMVPYNWYRIYNRLFVVPAAPNNPLSFLVGPRNLLKVWFSGRHGLFSWSPIVLLSVLGIFAAMKRSKALFFVIALGFLLQSLIDASVHDWWGGWAFGMRRLVELFPLYVFGLAFLIEWARLRLGTMGRAVTLTFVGLSTLWSLVLMLLYMAALLHPDEGTVADAIRVLVELTPDGFASMLATLGARIGL